MNSIRNASFKLPPGQQRAAEFFERMGCKIRFPPRQPCGKQHFELKSTVFRPSQKSGHNSELLIFAFMERRMMTHPGSRAPLMLGKLDTVIYH